MMGSHPVPDATCRSCAHQPGNGAGKRATNGVGPRPRPLGCFHAEERCATFGFRTGGAMTGTRLTTPTLRISVLAVLSGILCIAASSRGGPVLVEAESFAERGGWSLDTQFIHIM